MVSDTWVSQTRIYFFDIIGIILYLVEGFNLCFLVIHPFNPLISQVVVFFLFISCDAQCSLEYCSPFMYLFL